MADEAQTTPTAFNPLNPSPGQARDVCFGFLDGSRGEPEQPDGSIAYQRGHECGRAARRRLGGRDPEEVAQNLALRKAGA